MLGCINTYGWLIFTIQKVSCSCSVTHPFNVWGAQTSEIVTSITRNGWIDTGKKSSKEYI